jgi:hypothetical protein
MKLDFACRHRGAPPAPAESGDYSRRRPNVKSARRAGVPSFDLKRDSLGAIIATLRTSPTMVAGIGTRLWSMGDRARLIERREDVRSGAALAYQGFDPRAATAVIARCTSKL